MYNIMDQRSIWLAALRDLIDVIMLPRVHHALYTMSTRQLRIHATRMVKIENIWNPAAPLPLTLTRHAAQLDIRRVEILFGGTHIVTLSNGGILQLYPFQKPTNACATVARLHDSSRFYLNHHLDMRRAFSTGGTHWIMVVDCYYGVE